MLNDRQFGGYSRTKWLELQLLEHIRQNKLGPHDRFLSELEIVHNYSLNQTTVRQTLTRMVSNGVLYRVNGKGTFISPPQKNRQILIVSRYSSTTLTTAKVSLTDFFMASCSHAELVHHAASPILLDATIFQEQLDDLTLRYPNLAGVIFFSDADPAAKAWRYLERMGVQAIYFGSADSIGEYDTDINRLVFSQEAIVQTALQSFLSRGYQSIGIAACLNRPARIQRHRRFLEQAAKAGFGPGTVKELILEPGKTLEERNADDDAKVRSILKEQTAPCAWFCVDDTLAWRLLNSVYRCGGQVPRDAGILGVNNYPFSTRTVVPISSIEISFTNAACRCMDILLHENTPMSGLSELLSCNLVNRDSLQNQLS